MKIECTSNEKENIIEALATGDICVFDGKCGDYVGDCRQCARCRIQWIGAKNDIQRKDGS